MHQAFPFYLVYTDPENERHHGLRSNTAPYVLTLQPGAEDRIFAGGSVHVSTDSDQPGTVFLSAEVFRGRMQSLSDPTYVRVLSHPGRAATLGEDGLEDAYGHPCLLDLLWEKVSWARLETGEVVFYVNDEGWKYAPVDAEVFSEAQRVEQGLELRERAEHRMPAPQQE